MAEVLDKYGFEELIKKIDELLVKKNEGISNTPEIINIDNKSNIVPIKDIPLCSYVIVKNPVNKLNIDLSGLNIKSGRKNIIYIQFKTIGDNPEVSFANNVLWSTESNPGVYKSNELYRLELSAHPTEENTLFAKGYYAKIIK